MKKFALKLLLLACVLPLFAQKPAREPIEDDLYYTRRQVKMEQLQNNTKQDFRKGAKLLEFKAYEKDSVATDSNADKR